MEKKYKILIALAFLVFASFLYANVFFDRQIIEVKRGDLIEELEYSAEVVSSDEVELAFDMPGKISKVFFEEGDLVESGDLLVSLRSEKLQAELKKAESELSLAKAQLSQFLAGTSGEEINFLEAQVELARVDLENALQNFENVKIKADNDLKQKYQQALDISDSVLLTATKSMDSLKEIYQPNNKFQPFFFIPNFNKRSDAEWQIIFTKDAFLKIKENYDLLKKDPSYENIDEALSNFKVNLEVIRVALIKTSEALQDAYVVFGDKTIEEFRSDIARSRAGLNSIQTEILNRTQAIEAQKIQNKNNIKQAENQVKAKRASLLEKEGELALKKAKPRDVEIALYEAKVQDALAKKDLIKRKIENLNLLAPSSGVIKKIYKKQGELAKQGEPIISMALVSDFQVKADIPKEDREKIKVGDKAVIFYGDKNEIEGNVVYISDEILDDKNKSSSIFVAPSEKSKLKPGMYVLVNVKARVRTNAVVIPKDAVFENSKGDKFVFVFDNGKEKKVKITTGKESYQMIEVVSGLYEGDKLVIK